MTPNSNDELAQARRFVRRQLKRGATIVPPESRFFGMVLEHIGPAMLNGGPSNCGHPKTSGSDGKLIVVTTFGDRAWTMLCFACFNAEPVLRHCQACDRQPSPGLRTVLATDGCAVFVGRLCRGCRLGRVA